MRRVLSVGVWSGVLACASVAAAQADDPSDSSKVLRLTSFAAFETIPYLSGAIDLDHPKDGSGRVFVSTNEGKIYGFSGAGEPLGLFVDLGAAGVLPDFNTSFLFSNNGLTYIAFHPDYGRAGSPGEGRLYTVYQSVIPGLRGPDYSGATLPTRPGDALSQYVIAEWRADASDPDRIDPSSRREVLRLEFSGPASGGHTVCWIGFNPFARPGDVDYGVLYIPAGDMNNGGGVPDHQHVQRGDNPFGKILRIDPLGGSGGAAYAIPPGNPLDDGGPVLDDDGNCEEIAAWGFRYPQNMSFARSPGGLGRLVVFDIGADDFEEVDLVDVGDNHGWTRYDGPAPGNGGTELLLPRGSVLEWPAAVYDHEIPNVPGAPPTAGPTAITGGYVVSDPGDPAFQGQLLWGDLPRGAFFHADFGGLLAADAGDAQGGAFVMDVSVDGSEPGWFLDITGAARGDVRFGVDESGRVFVVSRQLDTVFVTDLVADQSPVCAADRDGDGVVRTLDFLDYLNAWAAGEVSADLNGDGLVNTTDFLRYLNLFAAGCG